MSVRERLKHAWNAFASNSNNSNNSYVSNIVTYGGTTKRSDRERLRPSLEKSVVASLYNRIAIDVAAIPIKHVKINQNGSFEETINSGLNNCLSVEANLDQTGRELIFDAVLSMFDEGAVALVPVETSVDIRKSNSFDILSLRVGKIMNWYPDSVQVEVYDEKDGSKKPLFLPKKSVAIIENPFYSVMNEYNSTITRLIDKLNLLDVIDKQSGSGKLDLIIQLPYNLRSPSKKEQAKQRKQDIEDQLVNSQHGIAYIDQTEHVTQLNRSLDNNLMTQVEFLTTNLYSQLGITKEVFDGTADEQTMLNYYNRSLEPILSALTDEMIRKFLTKTARSQGQSIKFIRDPFRLVPVNQMADIADKFTRNEILSSNELRGIVGYRPIDDERANELRNRNLNASDEQLSNPVIVNE